jgi:HSP20 family protein
MPNKSWLSSSRDREAEPFRGFKNQLDSYFEDWFGRSIGGPAVPRMDVTEDDADVEVCLELPGVKHEDIDISIKGDRLIIRGEKKAEHESKEAQEGFVIHRVERTFGSFQRTLTVPYEADPERIEAEFKDGVLKIRLPKPEQAQNKAQTHKIAIKTKTAAGTTTASHRTPDQGAAPVSPSSPRGS